MLSTQSLSPGDFTSDGKHVLLCSTPSEANPRSNRMCKTAPTESTLLQETRVLLNKLNDENRNLRESNSALRAERKLWRQEELNKKHEQEEWKRKVFELQAHLQEKIQQQSDETHAFGVLQRDYDELKESLLRLQEESKTQQAVLCKAHEAIKLLSSNILESTSDDVPDAQAGELLEVIQNVSVSFDSMKRHSSNLKNQIHKHEEQERVLRSENSRLQREIIQLHQAMTNLSQMTSDSSSFLHRMIHPLQDTVVEQQAKIQLLSDILQQLKEFMTSAHLFDHKIAKCVQAERETFQSQILEQNRNLEESRTKCTLQSKRLHDTEKKLRVKEKEHAHAEQRWKTLREQLKDARRVLDDLAGKLEGESQRAIRLQHELHQTQLILTAERAERNALKHECEEQYDTEIASLKKENERIVKDLQGKIEVSKNALDEATLELASLREELRRGKRKVKMLEAVNQTLLDQQHQLLNELGQAEASLLQNHTARDCYSDPQNKVSPHSSPTSSQKVEESILL